MDILDRINKILQPVKQAIKQNPLRHLFATDFANVSYTDPQSGNQITFSSEYIREGNLVYLIFLTNDERWKNLAKGLPVNMQTQGTANKGWAEELTDYEEFLDILSGNPDALKEIKQRYGLGEELSILNLEQFKEFFSDKKLIRIKISR